MIPDWFYVTERRAAELGLTHSGAAHGIPIWLGLDPEHAEAPLVMCKLGICEPILTLVNHLEVTACCLLGIEPAFRMRVDRKVNN